MIPYGRQSISEDDIQAVVDVLKSDFLTQGQMVPAFEQAICSYTSADYAVAVNSGTAALHVACLALGLSSGDLLWTTPITFVASANCGLYCGADVDFVDIDAETWNISPEKLEQKLIIAEKDNRLPKVVVVVHLCGLPCDMEKISKLSKQYGFSVIEDACHALAAQYQNNPVGCCEYSDITVFSFHPVKPITTGEGGMAVTNNQALADKMTLLRSHGITKDPSLMVNEPDGVWYYEQLELGFNYRMTDIQAALGLSQLKRLDQFIGHRQAIAERYNEAFKDLPVTVQQVGGQFQSGWHIYVVRMLVHEKLSHEDIFNKLRGEGIGVNLHYMPVYKQPYFQQHLQRVIECPDAEAYYNEAITLPVYPEMTAADQSQVVSLVSGIVS